MVTILTEVALVSSGTENVPDWLLVFDWIFCSLIAVCLIYLIVYLYIEEVREDAESKREEETGMSATVEACESCGRLFHYPGFGAKYCPQCRELDNKNREKVKTYIRENGAANMYEISDATGVSVSTIQQYLRDCTLEIPEGSPIYIKCESCGCDIRSGRWCPACAARMSSELKGMFVGVGDVPKKTTSGKMRFLSRRE